MEYGCGAVPAVGDGRVGEVHVHHEQRADVLVKRREIERRRSLVCDEIDVEKDAEPQMWALVGDGMAARLVSPCASGGFEQGRPYMIRER